MGQISKKLRSVRGGHAHYCPGCERMHVIPDSWKFDGNVDCPTFDPSVNITYPGPDAGKMGDDGHRAPQACCHYFLKAGILNFCGDSTHKLAGLQSVELPDLPESYKDWS